MSLTADDIYNHLQYAASNVELVSLDVSVFHHHFHILKPLASLINARAYLEIGSNQRASLHLLAKMPSITRFTAIDTSHNVPGQRAIIERLFGGKKAILQLHNNKSTDEQLLRQLYTVVPNPLYDLIFVDARSHDHATIMAELTHYVTLLSPGGVLVIDDYADSPDVHRAVDHFIKHEKAKLLRGWHIIGQLDNRCRAVPYDGGKNSCFLIQRPTLQAVGPECFGIVIATYNRLNVGPPVVQPHCDFLSRALQSIQAQTDQNWKVFLVGDHHTDVSKIYDVMTELKLTDNQICFTNLPLGFERDFISDRDLRWTIAGATAMNYGLALAQLNQVTFMAHIDDDDVWMPNHLAVHRTELQADEKVQVVFTRAMVRIEPSYTIPTKTLGDTKILPQACDVIHASVSWRSNSGSHRYITEPTGRPADATLWREFERLGLHGHFKDIITVNYNQAIEIGPTKANVQVSEEKSSQAEILCFVLVYEQVQIVKQSLSFLTRYADRLKIVVIENYSANTVSTIQPYITKLLHEHKIWKYYLFDENITNNALKIVFEIAVNTYMQQFRHVMVTDGDVDVVDPGWLDEEMSILEQHPETFVCGMSFDFYNLPVKTFPESVNWVPVATDCGDYFSGFTGLQLLLFRVSQFVQYWNDRRRRDAIFVDSDMHRFCESKNLRWARTKRALVKHLTWDLYADRSHPYTIMKVTTVNLWHHDRIAKFTLFENPPPV